MIGVFGLETYRRLGKIACLSVFQESLHPNHQVIFLQKIEGSTLGFVQLLSPFLSFEIRDTAFYGARGGRTLTVSPPTDFKSVASADSAIAPACAAILPYFEMLSNREALSLFSIYLARQSLMMNGMYSRRQVTSPMASM